MLSRFAILSIRGAFMGFLWNLPFLKIAKWKPIWKPPLWNFIIARNSVFVNTKRKVFAQMLRFWLDEYVTLVELYYLVGAVFIDLVIDLFANLFGFI